MSRRGKESWGTAIPGSADRVEVYREAYLRGLGGMGRTRNGAGELNLRKPSIVGVQVSRSQWSSKRKSSAIGETALNDWLPHGVAMLFHDSP